VTICHVDTWENYARLAVAIGWLDPPEPPAQTPAPVGLGIQAAQPSGSPGCRRWKTTGARHRSKYALASLPRHWRARPIVSDLKACPMCGAAMTGRRPLTAGFVLVTNVPACLRCDARARPAYGTRSGRKPKRWFTRRPAPRPVERSTREVDLLIALKPPAEGTLRRRLWERRQREQEAA